jgi:hypothetical protein
MDRARERLGAEVKTVLVYPPVGAEAVLKLRAMRAGHDFEQYRAFHEAREHERNHQALYKNGLVQPTVKPYLTPKQPRLKRVK